MKLKKKIISITISIIFILLYIIKGVYLSVFGVSFIFLLSYINTFFTISFYFSEGFIGKSFYFWKKDDVQQNFTTLLYSLMVMIFICSLLFPLNDSKELGNQYIWGCYIEYAFAGIGFIWVIGLILSFILLVIGLINPSLVKFQRRDKLFYSLLVINIIAFILIFIMISSIKLLSHNLHGATSSCS